jgi:hypothetical protein
MKRRVHASAFLFVSVSGLSLLCASTGAFAGSELTPGVSTGLALGAPLPEGLYSITIPTWGSRSTNPATDVGALVPAWVIWSTPWTLLGGRIGFDVATPVAQVSIGHPVGLNKTGWLNPLVEATLKWDLGNGFNFGLQEGVHLPVDGALQSIGVAYDFASFQQVASLSYLRDGLNLTATAIYGTGRNGNRPGSYAPEWFNYDLTATKTVGKWEFGPIAFGSTDLSAPYAGYLRQSQFALGGLVGYNLGQVVTQLKLTRDVYQANYFGYETRLWANIIVTLWTPPPSPVIATKY